MANHPTTSDTAPAIAPDVAFQFDDAAQQHEAVGLGMWAFLITELMFFGGVFCAYIVYRAGPNGESFLEAGRHLDWKIGAFNTGVLLISSLTMALAVHAAQTNRRGALMGLLTVTMLCGLTFLGVKVYEYHHKWVEHHVPGRYFEYPAENGEAHHMVITPRGTVDQDAQAAQMFFIFYFIMTGIHGLHIVVGLGLMVWLWSLAARTRDPARNFNPYEVVGLYWHFVDIVWIFLYPVLYLTKMGHG